VIDLMFAAALSGLRAAEAANGSEQDAVHSGISRTVAAEKRTMGMDEWLPPSLTFEEESDCPIFFEKELSGFGKLRVGPLCNEGAED